MLWLAALPLTMFTPVGLFLAVPAFLFLEYSILDPGSPSRTVFLLALAAGVLNYLVALSFYPRVQVERRLPERVAAGTLFRVHYHLTNRRKRWPALDLEIGAGRLRGLQPRRLPGVGYLAGGAAVQVDSEWFAQTRGCYELRAPAAYSTFPWGLTRIWGGRARRREWLRVHPRYTELRNIDLPSARRFQSELGNRVAKVSEAMDFAGCREYRAGDNIRHIFWKATAKLGKPVVREFQDIYLARAALIVDCAPLQKPWGPAAVKAQNRSLEAALSLAAAAAEYLMRHERVVDIFAVGGQVYFLQAGRGTAPFPAVLDLLSEVEPRKEPGFECWTPEVLRSIAEIGSAVVILLNYDPARAQLLDRLRAEGVAVKLLLIGAPQTALPPGAVVIAPEAVEHGEVVQL